MGEGVRKVPKNFHEFFEFPLIILIIALVTNVIFVLENSVEYLSINSVDHKIEVSLQNC